jgi:Ca2+-transporting ATPase
MAQSEFYKLSPEDACKVLMTNASIGLDDSEAIKRLAESGPNELLAAKKESVWMLFFAQFNNILIQIL